ncbi:MAG: alpha/beta fold hydrolase [Bacteroidales bacterium]|nr:alpha/beta fold hydrolase [Bacteroidales bacterium]
MDLFFRRYGTEGNPPLVILHGLFGISDNWVTFGRRIADEGFDVIIPDQRNHGHSPHSDTFNYLALTDDIYDLIERLNLRNVRLIGHSLGGKVAMRFTLENQLLVSKLLVIDISLKAYGDRPFHRNIIAAMQSVDFNSMNTRADVEYHLSERVESERIRQFLMKNLYWKDKTTLAWRINLEGIEKNLGEMFDAIETGILFAKPTLFIRGGQSDYILPEDYPKIRANFTRAEIFTIENASHWVHAEAPEQFYQLASGFLTGQPDWYKE